MTTTKCHRYVYEFTGQFLPATRRVDLMVLRVHNESKSRYRYPVLAWAVFEECLFDATDKRVSRCEECGEAGEPTAIAPYRELRPVVQDGAAASANYWVGSVNEAAVG